MNQKQFIRMLKVFDEDNERRSGLFYAQKEVLRTFLKRLHRANNNDELRIVKTKDVIEYNARQVSFEEKKNGVKFAVIIDYDLKKVSFLY